MGATRERIAVAQAARAGLMQPVHPLRRYLHRGAIAVSQVPEQPTAEGSAPDADEPVLLGRARNGDLEAIEALVRLHQRTVRAYVARLMPDPAEADDVAQEVFIAGLRTLGQLDPKLGLLRWLMVIARNRARDAWRRHRRRREVCGDEAFAALLAHAERSIEDDRLDHLRRCLENLPERALAVVHGHYRDELSCADLAAREGLSAGSVRSLLTRARDLLRGCIESRRGAPT